MGTRLLVAAVLAAVAAVIAGVAERRRARPTAVASAPGVPLAVDRADFPSTAAPWMVLLFSADRCESCAAVRPKVAALASDDVATFDAEESTHGDLHRRYGVDAAPMVLIIDAGGTVVRHFFGNVSATDLWAAVAEARVESVDEGLAG